MKLGAISTLLALASLALLPAASTAAESRWSIGSNLGVSFNSPDRGAHVTTFSLPGTVGGLMPGLRVGRRLAHPNAEGYFDGGLLYTTSEGAHQSGLALTANYQWNFSPAAPWTPFVDLGAGFSHNSYSSGSVTSSGTSLRLGLGGGVRRALGDSGTLRAAVRWDHDSRATDKAVVVNPGGSVITIKLGFDLWLR